MTVSKQTNAELIDYKFKIMNDEFKAYRIETKEDMKALHSKIDSSTLALHAKMDDFIEASQKTYVTRIEHEENKKAIQEMQKEQRMFITKALVSFWAAIIAWIIWVSDIILKKLWII